ncbi:hypothetical protein M405DRAFT_938786 [Rhizopogon salebrosus TDB-379]|nr:hypothetical protein M405DRAFT_938786 [Rhizopogon salebrosus TDB-379]
MRPDSPLPSALRLCPCISPVVSQLFSPPMLISALFHALRPACSSHAPSSSSPALSWSVTLFDTVPSPSDEVIPAELCRTASDQRYTTGKHRPEFPSSVVKFRWYQQFDHGGPVFSVVFVTTH